MLIEIILKKTTFVVPNIGIYIIKLSRGKYTYL